MSIGGNISAVKNESICLIQRLGRTKKIGEGKETQEKKREKKKKMRAVKKKKARALTLAYTQNLFLRTVG